MILAEVILGVGAFGIYTLVLPGFIPKFTTVLCVCACTLPRRRCHVSRARTYVPLVPCERSPSPSSQAFLPFDDRRYVRILAISSSQVSFVSFFLGLLRSSQVTHVGAMVDRHILSDCLVKQKKAFQHRSLPPTLRQVIYGWWEVGVEGGQLKVGRLALG